MAGGDLTPEEEQALYVQDVVRALRGRTRFPRDDPNQAARLAVLRNEASRDSMRSLMDAGLQVGGRLDPRLNNPLTRTVGYVLDLIRPEWTAAQRQWLLSRIDDSDWSPPDDPLCD